MKKKFTKEEDSKICQLVNQYGAKNWDQIAKNVPGRTGRQCRDRYHNYLIPGFFNGEWTKEEDDLLNEKVNLMGCQWSKMMKYFPRRSANSLRNRWNYFVCKYKNEIKNKNDSRGNLSNEIYENQKRSINISNIKIPENINFPIQNNQFFSMNFTKRIEIPLQNEVIVKYGVKVSTQTNESDFNIENNNKSDLK